MDKLHAALSAAVLVAAAVGARAVYRASAWEQKVNAAEAHVGLLQSSVDSLKNVASRAEASAAHTDTVRVTLTKLIPQTDSASHPDSTCRPSLEVRDRALAAAANELTAWQIALQSQIELTAKIAAQRDTLRSTLDARPHGGATLELLHPRVHLSLQAMVYPEQRLGVGLSFDLASIRL